MTVKNKGRQRDCNIREIFDVIAFVLTFDT